MVKPSTPKLSISCANNYRSVSCAKNLSPETTPRPAPPLRAKTAFRRGGVGRRKSKNGSRFGSRFYSSGVSPTAQRGGPCGGGGGGGTLDSDQAARRRRPTRMAGEDVPQRRTQRVANGMDGGLRPLTLTYIKSFQKLNTGLMLINGMQCNQNLHSIWI